MAGMVSFGGVPVVLLHAFPLSSRMYEPLRSAAELPFPLLTPDFRGAAGRPLGGAAPSVDVMADDVVALLDEHGIDRAVIGGVSMGGYVTMAVLRRHPDRVTGLVLADTKAAADADPARENRLRMARTLEAGAGVRVLVDEVLPTLVGPTTTDSRPQVLAFVRSLVEATPPGTAAWWQRAMAARPDSTETLRRAGVPALVIVGDEDGLAPPSQAEAMAAALPHGRLHTLARAGHLSAVETPAAFAAALVEFVAGLGRPGATAAG